MQRRAFIALATAALAVPMSGAYAETKGLDYQPELLQARLAAGEVVFLDFKASWCSTCKAQEQVIDALKAANPDYAAKITFINVDWDQWGKSAIVKDMKIPRRSTLVALKGNAEIGRIVAGTGQAEIKALMDKALQAAV